MALQESQWYLPLALACFGWSSTIADWLKQLWLYWTYAAYNLADWLWTDTAFKAFTAAGSRPWLCLRPLRATSWRIRTFTCYLPFCDCTVVPWVSKWEGFCCHGLNIMSALFHSFNFKILFGVNTKGNTCCLFYSIISCCLSVSRLQIFFVVVQGVKKL